MDYPGQLPTSSYPGQPSLEDYVQPPSVFDFTLPRQIFWPFGSSKETAPPKKQCRTYQDVLNINPSSAARPSIRSRKTTLIYDTDFPDQPPTFQMKEALPTDTWNGARKEIDIDWDGDTAGDPIVNSPVSRGQIAKSVSLKKGEVPKLSLFPSKGKVQDIGAAI